VYSNFIDGLSKALKKAGFGIHFAGRVVPLLMYADDVVLLSSSQTELAAMNDVATKYAHMHRFQFNGSKSGVMIFGATTEARARAANRRWQLFGERVKIKDSYVYLGTVTPADGLSWKDHVTEAFKKAKRRSADLLWICRSDRGMRSRTAATLWKAMVRPLLEYASEIWAGQISAEQVKEAETIQMTFLRGTLGLHANGSGVSNEVIRAETGCERIQDRWTKLKLGYWKRVFEATPQRLLRMTATYRHQDRVSSSGTGRGTRGWMKTVEKTLKELGLGAYWDDPTSTAGFSKSKWRSIVYEAVERDSDGKRSTRMSEMKSTIDYVDIKDWGLNTETYSFSSGEIGRLGQHVPERYLDDRQDLKGTRLKLLCRTGCLPVMDRVGREEVPSWPKDTRICLACGLGKVEDVRHFLMECPRYARKRATFMERVGNILAGSDGTLDMDTFGSMDDRNKCAVILGKRIGDVNAENLIDQRTKKFLSKCWNLRSDVTEAVNIILNTKYGVFSSAA
jgi:hypothetical protein